MPELQLSSENYINRELSWIEFNRRVLAEAQNPRNPLLERLKFLAIFSNNLDEFYMVRIASYHNKLQANITRTRPDGLTPVQVLTEAKERLRQLLQLHRDLLVQVLAELAQESVHVIRVAALPANQQAILKQYYQREIFPVLTPFAVDHARPFPFISNLSLNLAVWLERNNDDSHHAEFARIKVPNDVIPRLIHVEQVVKRYGNGLANELDPNTVTFIWLEDLIASHLDTLFPGMNVIEAAPFRVTRNADIDFEHELDDSDNDYDMAILIENSLKDRRFGRVVRLSVQDDISDRILSRLVKELDVDAERDVYRVEGALGTSALFSIYGTVQRPDLRDQPHVPHVPSPISQSVNIFDVIAQRDMVVHHPYDSFSPVEDFFRTAATDPNVLAIKATLYRVGKNSPIVQALMDARANDKQVAVLVELKARFDEENNLEWARAMEEQGVHVTYGVQELPVKTHSKIALVVRKEKDGVRRYVHLGTGNYNASTARLYTDIGLFTDDEAIADDASHLFNRLTGYAPETTYHRLLVAPEYLHSGLIGLIDNEIQAAKEGKPARLIFKMNQIEEDDVILKLYEASQAGVQIDLIVRGLCCLRPNVPGYSENIRVMSVVGRFLEHSRIYYFENAPEDQRLYCGSADLMRRNLLNRVETVFPIIDPINQKRIQRILFTSLLDNDGAWELMRDGSYQKRVPQGETINSQQIFTQSSYGITSDKLRHMMDAKP